MIYILLLISGERVGKKDQKRKVHALPINTCFAFSVHLLKNVMQSSYFFTSPGIWKVIGSSIITSAI